MNNTFSRSKKYFFTDEELDGFTDELVESIKRKAQLTERGKRFAKAIKDRIEPLDNGINECVVALDRKYEVRSVDCIAEFDYEAGTKSYIELATGDLIDTEPMSYEERQLRIDDEVSPRLHVVRHAG